VSTPGLGVEASFATLAQPVAAATVREPYFLGLDRAMVSLGPLTDSTYCTFKCKFCYVNGPYPKYARRNADEISEWLRTKRTEYSIVYISGDTDSFAPPRTQEALRLLENLIDLDTDVLFTTRYVFTSSERRRLGSLFTKYSRIGRLLIPCISISQLTHPELEPPPIPSPASRFEQMTWLHAEGAKTLLTVRPFIPYIEAEEYAEIVRLGAPYSAAVLGGDWYTDPEGIIDGMTRKALDVARTLLVGDTVSRELLDSVNDTQEWVISRHPKAASLAASAAHAASKRFFMRSTPAINALRRDQ
jgi:hypothetical protein